MAKKKQYTVTIPITGYLSFEVKAADEDTAKEAAWDAYNAGKWNEKEDVMWEACEEVTRGNVCSAMQNEVEVMEHE